MQEVHPHTVSEDAADLDLPGRQGVHRVVEPHGLVTLRAGEVKRAALADAQNAVHQTRADPRPG